MKENVIEEILLGEYFEITTNKNVTVVSVNEKHILLNFEGESKPIKLRPEIFRENFLPKSMSTPQTVEQSYQEILLNSVVNQWNQRIAQAGDIDKIAQYTIEIFGTITAAQNSQVINQDQFDCYISVRQKYKDLKVLFSTKITHSSTEEAKKLSYQSLIMFMMDTGISRMLDGYDKGEFMFNAEDKTVSVGTPLKDTEVGTFGDKKIYISEKGKHLLKEILTTFKNKEDDKVD